MKRITTFFRNYAIDSIFATAFLLGVAVQAETPVTYIGYSDYHIVTDFSFDADSYFRQMDAYGVTLQRIWVMGYSNVSDRPERMPFLKIGNQYDLKKIDPVFIGRLRSILTAAQRNHQRVMLTLFDRWTLGNEDNFVRTPWYYKNNIQRLLRNSMPDFHDIHNEKLLEIQQNYVKAIVSATQEFNPIYEIMNEARLQPDCRPVLRWHNHVARWILEEYPEAEIAVNVGKRCTDIFEAGWVDVISLHFDQWNNGICDAIQDLRPLNKEIIIDTDGAFKERVDNRLVKQWLTETLRCGASFNHKDDIHKLDREALELFRQKSEAFAPAD